MTAQHHRGRTLAMGGGGLSMEPDNPLLDDFLLSLSRRRPARVCFIGTASGDSPGYVTKFYRAFAARSVATDLTLQDSGALPRHPKTTAGLAAFAAEQDVFYVGGGNTLHLLALWRAHGLDVVLRERWHAGAILAGVSAGMLCLFSGCLTDSFGELAPIAQGLGLLDGSACPHYDEPGRKPAYQRAILAGFLEGYAADDGAALHFEGERLVEVVTSRPHAAAYRVFRENGEVVEERLSSRFLGASPSQPSTRVDTERSSGEL